MVVARLSGLDGEVAKSVGHDVSLFVGFPSLFVAPSGERLALTMCWRGISLSTISRVFASIFFPEQNFVVDVARVAVRSRAVVVWRGVVAGCTRISSQKYVHEK